MISAVGWVPRGVFRATPLVVQPTERELAAARETLEQAAAAARDDGDDGSEESEEEDAMSDDSEDQGQDAEQAVRRAQAAAAAVRASGSAGPSQAGGAATGDIEAAMKELDMDHYDSDDAGAAPNLMQRLLAGKGDVFLDPDGDPYLTVGDDEDSEAEDLTIKQTDHVILAARHEEDISNLEVWVYEEAEADSGANVYIHHDIVLPAFPLCVAWLDCDPTGSRDRSNLVAVGTLEPGIELWDLDVVDSVEPLVTLGGPVKGAAAAAGAGPSGVEDSDEEEPATAMTAAQKKKLKKKRAAEKKKAASKKPALVPGSHTDSVLGLSWNREFRNVLASSSADKTVKVWDVSRGAVEHTLHHHAGKVQAVAWNPVESPVLLSGSFAKDTCLVDVRTPTGDPLRWRLTADCEALCWHPHEPTCFIVSSEDGMVCCFDARKGAGSAALFQLSAHSKPTCTISFSSSAPGLMATGSTDKKVKLWDVRNMKPANVATMDLQVGAVFSTVFCHDAPHLLAVGGAKGAVTVWDVRCHEAVAARWPGLS